MTRSAETAQVWAGDSCYRFGPALRTLLTRFESLVKESIASFLEAPNQSTCGLETSFPRLKGWP